MRILWVATKPPVPPTDGGRLVALATLRALAAAGHEVTVVAPVAGTAMNDTRRAARAAGIAIDAVAGAPRSWPSAVVVALARGVPLTIARHEHAALGARVDARLGMRPFDVVHAEQVQAFAACAPARRHGLPVVLRAQNVESEAWASRAGRSVAASGAWPSAAWSRAWNGPAFRFEAARLARFEGHAVRAAAATVALTARDADRLRALGGDAAHVVHVPAPFDAELPAGAPLPGAPAIVAPGSAGWAPNDDARAWLLRAVWPAIATALPGAHLHLFGGDPVAADTSAITQHVAPVESGTAFPAGAIVLVALRAPLGVRMRILEAWARRVPVVATTAAAAGLEDGAADAVVTADEPTAIAAAVAALAGDPARRAGLVAAGAAVLRARHDPAAVAAALTAVYRDAIARA